MWSVWIPWQVRILRSEMQRPPQLEYIDYLSTVRMLQSGVEGVELHWGSGPQWLCLCYMWCQSTNSHILNRYVDRSLICKLHGGLCIGHLETDLKKLCTMLPSSMAPDTDNIANRYQRHKDNLCKQLMTQRTYAKLTSKIMMGKKGLIRQINNMRVDGTLKMVISIGRSGDEGTTKAPLL